MGYTSARVYLLVMEWKPFITVPVVGWICATRLPSLDYVRLFLPERWLVIEAISVA